MIIKVTDVQNIWMAEENIKDAEGSLVRARLTPTPTALNRTTL